MLAFSIIGKVRYYPQYSPTGLILRLENGHSIPAIAAKRTWLPIVSAMIGPQGRSSS